MPTPVSSALIFTLSTVQFYPKVYGEAMVGLAVLTSGGMASLWSPWSLCGSSCFLLVLSMLVLSRKEECKMSKRSCTTHWLSMARQVSPELVQHRGESAAPCSHACSLVTRLPAMMDSYPCGNTGPNGLLLVALVLEFYPVTNTATEV